MSDEQPGPKGAHAVSTLQAEAVRPGDAGFEIGAVQATTAQATAGSEGQQPRRFPYEDGAYAAQHLIHKMPSDELSKMLDLLIRHREESQTVPGR
ncbi:hypothetical protein ACFU98_46360 [Streptomyces sp. NPDC057575]|uniref:hypothetical protein n=1 Tax=unclassified Streptomyces TaxID=2593676 RepID=UPI00369803BC